MKKLAEEIAGVEWHWLRPHLERDAVIVVAPELDLAEAAAGIAADDTERVREWIASGRLGKPDRARIDAWNNEPTRRFAMLIVQPWVLIQETMDDPS